MNIVDRIREMMGSGNEEMRALGRKLQEEKYMRDRIGLTDILAFIQAYPEIIVTGSAALYLHGIRLDRWNGGSAGDLDIILPYYIDLQGEGKLKKLELRDDISGNSGLSFDYKYSYSNGVYTRLVDVLIDPKARYETIEFEEQKYKVGLLEDILEMKIKYAKSGTRKHKDDIYEMCGKTIPVAPVEVARERGDSY